MTAASHTAEKDNASLEKRALEDSPSVPSLDQGADREAAKPGLLDFEPKWYHSVFFNMTILGLCNFSAPGLWGAMNSLGAGGAACKYTATLEWPLLTCLHPVAPHLINAANALTFCLMVLSCWLGSKSEKATAVQYFVLTVCQVHS